MIMGGVLMIIYLGCSGRGKGNGGCSDDIFGV